jgi:hypothetical protein
MKSAMPSDEIMDGVNRFERGVILFSDGSRVRWTKEEWLPYAPSENHHDEGMIVTSDSGTSYFISHMTGTVYGESDSDDPMEGLTREIDGAICPSVARWLEQRARWEEEIGCE